MIVNVFLYYCNNVVLCLDKGWHLIGNYEKQASVYGQHKHCITDVEEAGRQNSVCFRDLKEMFKFLLLLMTICATPERLTTSPTTKDCIAKPSPGPSQAQDQAR